MKNLWVFFSQFVGQGRSWSDHLATGYKDLACLLQIFNNFAVSNSFKFCWTWEKWNMKHIHKKLWQIEDTLGKVVMLWYFDLENHFLNRNRKKYIGRGRLTNFVGGMGEAIMHAHTMLCLAPLTTNVFF